MRVLVIGNLHSQLIEAIAIAKKQGAEVAHADSVEAAFNQLVEGKGADIALIDVALDVEHFITSLQQERVQLNVVAYGIDNDTQSAVTAIKAGAKEFLPLPPDEAMIAAILETISANQRSMIGSSPAMQQVTQMAERIAPSAANVLITGESGTGKEVMARFIHDNSTRKDKTFVSVNCAAIPDNLLESELFGHEKGAFTGATHRRVGKFEESSGGTLLLDEISEMDIRMQAKLLRAIQEREIDRVGGAKPVPVDLRILATSNRDLEAEVKAGNFREDLMFRLNVIQLQLPPLRQRGDDVVALAKHFVEKFCKANDLASLALSSAAVDALKSHAWKGNIRELENTIHRAVLLTLGNEITPDALQLAPTVQSGQQSGESGGSMVGKTVEQVEKSLILDTLDHCLGNRTQAANILGISIRTLRNKLNQYQDEAHQDITSSGA